MKKGTSFRTSNKRRISFFLWSIAIVSASVLSFLAYQNTGAKISSFIIKEPAALGELPVEIPNYRYGFALDTFQVTENEIKPKETLADILIPHKVSFGIIEKLVEKAKPVFDVRNIRPGKKYLILSKDSLQSPDFFIYEPNVFGYILFDMRDTMRVVEHKYPIETKIRQASGVITSSLWNTMTDNGLSYELAAKMEDAFAWSIDFHHIQQNDRFKLVFEEQYIDGEAVDVGNIKAAFFHNSGNDYYAYFYKSENYEGFFDAEGRPMKKAFLKSPVKYSRISSRFNPRRFHPILKRVRPHLGTDYAAPRGTPILAVADGRVTKASYSRGNGNYVKIKHDDTYQTQYLHMSKFAKGISPGAHVKQGQVIGYVGSTGLATGPHVCFRFWKHGRQVNHLRENLPPPEPMNEAELPKYFLQKDSLHKLLEEVQFEKTIEEKDTLKQGISEQVPLEEKPNM